MSQSTLAIVGGVGLAASALAVALWFWASLLKVPNNQDRFIDVLPKIGRLNAYAAFAASVAAACVAIVWLVGAYSD
ncbi:MAG: hypothetical protein WB662_13150 [Methyloceanibacter sp.]|jgi:hypothetical protein